MVQVVWHRTRSVGGRVAAAKLSAPTCEQFDAAGEDDTADASGGDPARDVQDATLVSLCGAGTLLRWDMQQVIRVRRDRSTSGLARTRLSWIWW